MGMNVGKSVKLLLLKRGMTREALAEGLELSPTRISKLSNTRYASGATIDNLASFFNMTPSEFIAVGEDEEIPHNRRSADKGGVE